MISDYVTSDLEYDQLYEAYLDCRKNKRSSKSQIEYEFDLENNLVKLYHELKDRTWRPGISITFIITRPKPREVFAANFKDRIVHHLLIRQIEYLFESVFIEDNYNCRNDKGVLYGVSRLSEKLENYTKNYKKEAYIAKFDFVGFFMNIDKTILWNKLEKFLRINYKKPNLEFLLWISKLIVFQCPEENCEYHGDPKLLDLIPPEKSLRNSGHNFGLPIGNLTSQIFANFYLHEFDLLVTKMFHGGYGRYVDDLYVISEDKQKILDFRKFAKKYLLENLGIQLHKNKFYLQPASHGIKFIGYVIKPGRIYTGSVTISNFYEVIKVMNYKINNYSKTKFLEELNHLVSQWNSYIGFMVHTKSFDIRRNAFKTLLDRKWSKYVNIDNRYILKIKNRYRYKKLELV